MRYGIWKSFNSSWIGDCYPFSNDWSVNEATGSYKVDVEEPVSPLGKDLPESQ